MTYFNTVCAVASLQRNKRYFGLAVCFSAVAGIIVTIAQSWSLCLLLQKPRMIGRDGWKSAGSGFFHDVDRDVWWRIDVWKSVGRIALIEDRLTKSTIDDSKPWNRKQLDVAILPTWSSVHMDHQVAPHNMVFVREWAYGWPCHALSYSETSMIDSTFGSTSRRAATNIVTNNGVSLGNDNMGRQRIAPARILFTGFVIDTVIAAGTMSVIACIGPFWRTYARACRGACLTCGYPTGYGVNLRCSECGTLHAVPRCSTVE